MFLRAIGGFRDERVTSFLNLGLAELAALVADRGRVLAWTKLSRPCMNWNGDLAVIPPLVPPRIFYIGHPVKKGKSEFLEYPFIQMTFDCRGGKVQAFRLSNFPEAWFGCYLMAEGFFREVSIGLDGRTEMAFGLRFIPHPVHQIEAEPVEFLLNIGGRPQYAPIHFSGPSTRYMAGTRLLQSALGYIEDAGRMRFPITTRKDGVRYLVLYHSNLHLEQDFILYGMPDHGAEAWVTARRHRLSSGETVLVLRVEIEGESNLHYLAAYQGWWLKPIPVLTSAFDEQEIIDSLLRCRLINTTATDAAPPTVTLNPLKELAALSAEHRGYALEVEEGGYLQLREGRLLTPFAPGNHRARVHRRDGMVFIKLLGSVDFPQDTGHFGLPDWTEMMRRNPYRRDWSASYKAFITDPEPSAVVPRQRVITLQDIGLPLGWISRPDHAPYRLIARHLNPCWVGCRLLISGWSEDVNGAVQRGLKLECWAILPMKHETLLENQDYWRKMTLGVDGVWHLPARYHSGYRKTVPLKGPRVPVARSFKGRQAPPTIAPLPAKPTTATPKKRPRRLQDTPSPRKFIPLKAKAPPIFSLPPCPDAFYPDTAGIDITMLCQSGRLLWVLDCCPHIPESNLKHQLRRWIGEFRGDTREAFVALGIRSGNGAPAYFYGVWRNLIDTPAYDRLFKFEKLAFLNWLNAI